MRSLCEVQLKTAASDPSVLNRSIAASTQCVTQACRLHWAGLRPLQPARLQGRVPGGIVGVEGVEDTKDDEGQGVKDVEGVKDTVGLWTTTLRRMLRTIEEYFEGVVCS